MHRLTRTLTVAAVTALTLAGSVTAATIVGTARNDTLRGTPRADAISGKAGNDRLFGLAGNDTLTGGPGRDTLSCGPGRDVAVAGPGDRIGPDCETVRGLPSVSIADASADEGDNGQTTLSFTVSLDHPVGHAVSVRYATSEGTASAPADYAAASGVLQLSPGETSRTIAVAVVGDIEVEPDETLNVALSNPVDAIVGDGTATGTIRNEDRPRPRSGLYRGTTSLGKGISFEVSPDLSRLTQLSIGFDLRCSNGAIIPDESLSFGSAALSIVPRAWTFGVNVPIDEQDFRGTVSFAGVLTAPGSASGTFQFDFNIPSFNVSCTTGHVSWTAS